MGGDAKPPWFPGEFGSFVELQESCARCVAVGYVQHVVMDKWETAVIHAFKGARFDDGALDVDVVGWLAAYRDIVLEVARSLWQRENAERQRLPKGFDERFQLRLSGLERGCAKATLQRRAVVGEQLLLLSDGDLFSKAMKLVEASVDAAEKGEQLPQGFPRSALPKFRRWGMAFREDESVEIRSPSGAVLAAYTPQGRATLLERIDTSYENTADEVGYVLATSIRAGKFELYRERHSGEGVDVPLGPEYEQEVLSALAAHDETRLRVRGTGAYNTQGNLVRFVQVERVEPAERKVDNSSLWEAIDAIAQGVSEQAWAQLPTDAAEHHDRYLQQ